MSGYAGLKLGIINARRFNDRFIKFAFVQFSQMDPRWKCNVNYVLRTETEEKNMFEFKETA